MLLPVSNGIQARAADSRSEKIAARPLPADPLALQLSRLGEYRAGENSSELGVEVVPVGAEVVRDKSGAGVPGV